MSYAALGAAALTAGAGIYQGIQAGNMNKKNRKFQQEMWNMTNDYNSPVQQRRRLQEAGLNPNLIYGSSAPYNTAQNQQLPAGETPDYTSAGIQGLQNYIGNRIQQQQTANQTAKTVSDIANQNQQINESVQRSRNMDFDLGFKRETANTQKGILRNTMELGQQQTANALLDNRIKTIQEKYTDANERSKIALIGAQIKNANSLSELNQLQFKMRKDGTWDLMPEVKFLFGDKMKSVKQTFDKSLEGSDKWIKDNLSKLKFW